MNKVTINGKQVFEIDGNTVNGATILTDMIRLDERFYHVLQNGRSYNIEVIRADRNEKTISIRVNGTVYEAKVKDKFDQLMEQMGFDSAAGKKIRELKAPMPGLVIDIRVKAGDAVQKGDAVIVLEAMKMENVLKAAGDGVVKKIEVTKGVSVEKNHVLIVFE